MACENVTGSSEDGPSFFLCHKLFIKNWCVVFVGVLSSFGHYKAKIIKMLVLDFNITSANGKIYLFALQLLKNILRTHEIRLPSDCELSHDCIDLCRKLLRLNSG
jgi:hypothetical protein